MFKSILTTRRVFLVISCCSLFLLSACAATAQKQDSMEERVMARWNAVLADDFLAAYDFLSPGFRSSVSLQQYQRALILQQVKWTGARYIESEFRIFVNIYAFREIVPAGGLIYITNSNDYILYNLKLGI